MFEILKKTFCWICSKLAAMQQVSTCSKSAIEETLEKGVKYVQNKHWTYQDDASDVALVTLLLTLNLFHTFFNVCIVDFE